MLDKLMALVGQLYPKGRAFKIVVAGYRESLHRAISSRKEVLYADMVSTFDSVIPDNPNFSADDATAWEKRLGLITDISVDLEDRKAAIIRKMNYPGEYAARGHYLFLQEQLRKAKFNVFIYENRFDNGLGGYFTKDPLAIGGAGVVNQHGDFQHGDAQHGSYFGKLVVNYLEPELDASFDIGYNLRSTFFIGGEAIDPTDYMGEMADVPANRELEFRQLILRLKPTQTVGLLFVNYV
jgi:hypothetical protein